MGFDLFLAAVSIVAASIATWALLRLFPSSDARQAIPLRTDGGFADPSHTTDGGVTIDGKVTADGESASDIDGQPTDHLGKRLVIDHGMGIVFGETTVIGSHVKLYQGVTLGALSPRAGHASLPGKRHPTVCDYVTIYSGASILGGETVIGEHSVVGGNAFLTGSVADNTRVVIAAPETVFKNA